MLKYFCGSDSEPVLRGVDIYSTKNGTARINSLGDKLYNVDYYTGTVYGQTHVIGSIAYGIDPSNFIVHPSDYFKIGKWGDAVGGTAVLVELSNNEQFIGYLQKVDLSNIEVSLAGINETVYGWIGGQRISIPVHMPNYTFTSYTLGDDEVFEIFGADPYAFSFTYDAFKEQNDDFLRLERQNAVIFKKDA